jgi:heme oxygenase
MIDLKLATRNLHEKVEECFYPKQLFSGAITKDEYIAYLSIFYNLHFEIEQEFNKFDDKWSLYNFPYINYFRKHLIEEDLKNLSCSLQLDKSYLKKISIESFPQAIGFMYVLTGSTMGGMLLSNKVEQNIALKEYKSVNNYFLGFKENTNQMWGSFIRFLNNYEAKNSNDKEDIIKGAKNCFHLIIKELSNEK